MAFSFTAANVLHASDLNTYLQDSGWQPMAGSYATGWADLGGSFEVGRYRKIGRRVDIRGYIKNTNALSAGTDYTVLTMPAGYLPLSTAQPAWAGVTASGGARIHVDGGNLIIMPSTALSAASYIVITGSYFID